MRALSVSDGKQAWSVRIGKVGNADQQPAYPGTRSTPTIDGDVLYALGSDGDLVALDRGTGQVRWKKNVRMEFGGEPGTWGYCGIAARRRRHARRHAGRAHIARRPEQEDGRSHLAIGRAGRRDGRVRFHRHRADRRR